ncbi:MAG: type IV pilus twitching motility protein PilT [Gammaproteobacteria bacterium]|nr:type IV pilus twitching motility protein PilT [Gammaproteobacteria bacterium]
MNTLEDLLDKMAAQEGSDLHLVASDPPRMRHHGEIVTLHDKLLSTEWVHDSLYAIMPPRIQHLFEQYDNADFAFEREGIARYRVNVFRHLGGIGAVFRAIPISSYSLEQLALPAIISSLCLQKQGLVLVTGKTGSGKSTSLAAMVNQINETLRGHILTIEDPIEFVHQKKQCLVSQREVGEHTSSFANALRSALREDPDVILVGELRDLETIGLAVTAAETGILVMGTLHTSSAAGTIDRIINTFPAKKQPHIRTMLSTSLKGVITQQLVRRADGQGRVAAVEVLINTPAVGNIIREGKTEQLRNVLQGGSLTGMQSMDSALKRLLDAELIAGQDAYDAAYVKAGFEQ